MKNTLLLLLIFLLCSSKHAAAQRGGFNSINVGTTYFSDDRLTYEIGYEKYYDNWRSTRIGGKFSKATKEEKEGDRYMITFEYLPKLARGNNLYLKLPLGIEGGRFGKTFTGGGIVGLELGVVFKRGILFFDFKNDFLINAPQTWTVGAGGGIKILL